MKALSLWQPWASAIAVRAKRIETRSWATKYRGPLLIHAASKRDALVVDGLPTAWQVGWQAALYPLGCPDASLSFGAIVAVCTLSDCRPTETFTIDELDRPRTRAGLPIGCIWTERMMGDFSKGRWGWVLTDIQPLRERIPWKGRQGLFDVPEMVLDVRKQDIVWEAM